MSAAAPHIKNKTYRPNKKPFFPKSNRCNSPLKETAKSPKLRGVLQKKPPKWRFFLMVLGDGIEPPTRGFSVLCSYISKSSKLLLTF